MTHDGSVPADEKSRDEWYPGKFVKKLKGSQTTDDSVNQGLNQRDITTFSTPPNSSSEETLTETIIPLHRYFKPEWKGVIQKKGHRIKNWKSRFFVISNCMMLYYNSEAEYLSPEKCQKPLGYFIFTSITPTGSSTAPTPTASSGGLAEDLEYVIETLEDKTFHVKFPLSCGFLNAAHRAIGVQIKELQEVAEPQLKAAVCLCHIGYIDLSIQLLQTLAYKTSPSAESLYHLGTALLVNNDFADAIEVLQDCLDKHSSHVPAFINLATAFYCTNNMDHAKSLYESALSLEPSNVEAANNLSLLYTQSGTRSDFELAEFKIKYAISCRRDEPRLYLTYAEILMSVNEIERAIDVLFQGLKDVPSQDTSDLHMRLGALFFLKNTDKTEAIENFHLALGVDPRNHQARHRLREALLVRENTVSAKEALFHESEQRRDAHSSAHQQSANADTNAPLLQGMLEKNSGGDGGGWKKMYFELNRFLLRWFPSGTEFTRGKERGPWEKENTHVLVSDMVSVSRVPGSLIQFVVGTRDGGSLDLRTGAEGDTNTWLDTLQAQLVAHRNESPGMPLS